MDRFARIGVGYIATCIVGGVAVTVAGVLAPENAGLLRVLLIGAGCVAIAIGVIGIVIDLRRSSHEPSAPVTSRPGISAWTQYVPPDNITMDAPILPPGEGTVSSRVVGDPTEAEVEARAEIIHAQVQDVSHNIFGSPNIYVGMNQARIVARDQLQAESEDRNQDDPPANHQGQFWHGKTLINCPWDDYRTTTDARWIAHLETEHTEPPTPELAQGIYSVPRQWATTPIHYLGDAGGPSLSGVPADPDHTFYATPTRAEELIGLGLYGPGPVENQKHAFSGAVGRGIVCTCGYEAATVADLQSHLSVAE